MANSIIGTVISIGPTVTLTSKSGTPFYKREIVLGVRKFDPNTGEPIIDNTNTPCITFMGEKCRELDSFNTGQTVQVFFDLTGRSHTDASGIVKYFNDVRGYKVVPYATQGAASASYATASNTLNEAPVQTTPSLPKSDSYLPPF